MSRRHADSQPPLARAVAVACNRRRFLLGAGSLAGAAWLPLTVVGIRSAMAVPAEQLTDWTVDDMWGVYPRYADAIEYPAAAGRPVAARDAADTDWCD